MTERLESSLPAIDEPRTMGVAVIVTKTENGLAKALVFPDTTKQLEIATGTGWLYSHSAADQVFSFPGGGRQLDEEVVETASREFVEELLLDAPWYWTTVLRELASIPSSDIQQQSHPIFAGQIDCEARRANMIAVTSLHVPHDALSVGLQAHLYEQKVLGKLTWVSLQELHNTYLTLAGDFDRQTPYRPHIFPLAYYWLMVQKDREQEAVEKLEMEAQYTLLSFGNRARHLNIPVKNEFSNSAGKLIPPSQLSNTDAKYLYPRGG